MSKKRILYVSQEITPYSASSKLSEKIRHLPQAMNESGYEVRMFMPKFGTINERRHQLHEVIRLSGINLIVNDLDQPLIIKVASVPQARIQVYFIDNEDYFKRKFTTTDEEGNLFPDNDERMLFFSRGVLETVKKLGWAPDIIHCSGWMTSLLPLYLKEMFKNDPIFKNTQIVYADYNNSFDESLNKELQNKIHFDGVDASQTEGLETPSYVNLQKKAIQFSDMFVKTEETNSELVDFANEKGILVVEDCELENNKETYKEIYDNLLEQVQ
jgi:starch synthase